MAEYDTSSSMSGVVMRGSGYARLVTTGMYITRTSLRIQQQHAEDDNLQKNKNACLF